MSKLEQFKIDLKGMSEGDTTLEYALGDDFFEAVKAPVIHRGSVKAMLSVHRTDDVFDLDFHTEGFVTVQCDRCLDDMEQPVVSDSHLVAKLGDSYSEEDDLITVSENEGILDVSWFIYQFIELALPLRHVHAPGKCNPAMMKILGEYSAVRSGDGEGKKPVDSRWAALSKLKNKN